MSLVPFASRSSSATEPDEDSLDDTQGDGSGAKMTFLEHLDELRKRIIASLVSVAVGVLVAFFFVQQIYDFVMKPLVALLPKGGYFQYTEATEAFVLYMTMALLAGLMIAMPFVLWQVWMFIAPGLYRREKKLAFPFIILATVGFVGGAAFTHYLLFPWMWVFFASFATDQLKFVPKIEPVFSLYVKMIMGMGLVFQMPAIVYSLARMGIVTARFLIKSFRYAILIIFIAAAVITPSGDMLTQSLFAAPMIGLYIISIFIAWIFGKRRPKVSNEA